MAVPAVSMEHALLADSANEADVDPDLPWLQQAAAGDAVACRRLVERHLPRLHRYASRLLGDAAEADDVCQDAFVALWRQAARWRPGEARIATWLYRVVGNACHDRHRRRRPIEPLDAIDRECNVDDRAQPPAMLERHAQQLNLQAAIDQLPERQRQALLLFHLEGHSLAETAAVLQISIEALESLLARGRRALRQRLTAAGEIT